MYGLFDFVFVSFSCNICIEHFAGGSEPRLVEAATKQLKTLPFYHSFWNRTTKPSLVFPYLVTDSFLLNVKIHYMKSDNNFPVLIL